MEILNVITMNDGIINTIKSFVIPEHSDKEKRQEIINDAKKHLVDAAREIGYDGDEDELMDVGDYDNCNRKEVLIAWSDKVMYG